MSSYNFDRTYEKWKRLVARANIYIATLCLTTETLGYFILRYSNMIDTSVSYYLTRYLIVPTIFDFGVVAVSYVLMRHPHFAGRKGDFIPLVALVLLCVSMSLTHYIFPIVVGSLCFPIFVSTIYDNPRLTRNIWLLSYAGIFAVWVERKYQQIFKGVECRYLVMETFTACSLTLAAYISCGIFAKFQEEKNQIIEDMYQHELQLREELNRETKTGLYNYSAFANKLYRETEKSRFTQWPLMLVIMDIDHFKRINDTYGHAKGDIVLKQTADILKKYFKDDEFPARYGGEEFTAIVREGTVEELKARVEAMRGEFASQVYDFMSEAVTLSAGIVKWEKGMTDEKLFDCADKALYRAKELGRDRVEIWSEAYEKNV